MWFKRRKKTEQNQALDQSLRSLQSLLSETDRREPSLDRHGRAPDEGAPDASRGTAPPILDDDNDQDGVVLREPAPPDSASRWRELNLSFDAEPVMPPAPGPGGDTGPEGNEDAARKRDAPLDEAGGEPDETGSGEPEAGPRTTVPPDDTERKPRAPTVAGERTESQLHLELEPAQDVDDDIPTLTEPVYVPDSPPQAPSSPGPAEAQSPETPQTSVPTPDEPDADAGPTDDRIEWCVNQLRRRLRAMEEPPLAPEQEAQLRDTLSVLMDQRRDDEPGR